MVRLVSSVGLECGKNKSPDYPYFLSNCDLGMVNREIFPPGDSPSAIGFTPPTKSGIYCIVTGLNLRPEAHGSLWSMNQPDFDSRLLFHWAGRKVTVNHSSSLVSPPNHASSLHQFQSLSESWIIFPLQLLLIFPLPVSAQSCQVWPLLAVSLTHWGH